MRYQLRAGLMISAVAGLAVLGRCATPATAAPDLRPTAWFGAAVVLTVTAAV